MKEFEISKVFEEEIIPHTVRLPGKILQEFKNEAKKQGRSMGKLLTIIVVDYLNSRQSND